MTARLEARIAFNRDEIMNAAAAVEQTISSSHRVRDVRGAADAAVQDVTSTTTFFLFMHDKDKKREMRFGEGGGGGGCVWEKRKGI